MPQSLVKIYVHLIFSTKNRQNIFREEDLADVHAYIARSFNNAGSPAIAVGGTQDHVHVLFMASRTTALAKTIECIKRGTSKWLKTKAPCYAHFAWQEGYGAFSVSCSRVNAVRRYIQNQEKHHLAMSFADELKKFCNEYGVKYDERYW